MKFIYVDLFYEMCVINKTVTESSKYSLLFTVLPLSLVVWCELMLSDADGLSSLCRL